MERSKQRTKKWISLSLCLLWMGCAGQAQKKQYLLAEKLWSQREYESAVIEFDKIAEENPKSDLGTKALFRSAITESVFLNRQQRAVEKLKKFLTLNNDTDQGWLAEIEIGNILFLREKNWGEAIRHYEGLLNRAHVDAEKMEFLFKIGKAYQNMWNFKQAEAYFRRIEKDFPQGGLAQKATLEALNSQFMSWNYETEGLKKEVLTGYQEFIQKYKQGALVVEAKFNLANAYLEIGENEKALDYFNEIKETYPAPQIVYNKIQRILKKLEKPRRL